jgi:hypothetical protein
MSELDTFTGAADVAVNPDAAPKAKKTKAPKEPKAPKAKKEKVVKEPKPKRDNIALIASVDSIAQMRSILAIANAKRAKSVGKPEAQARYTLEIDAAKAKLKELLDSCKTVADLIKADEEDNKVITFFIGAKEAEYEAWVAANGFKVGKAALKGITDEIPDLFYEEVGIDLPETLVKRHEKMDYRLKALCQKYNFKAMVEAGKIVFQNNKWVDPNAPVAAAEPAPAEAAAQ